MSGYSPGWDDAMRADWTPEARRRRLLASVADIAGPPDWNVDLWEFARPGREPVVPPQSPRDPFDLDDASWRPGR